MLELGVVVGESSRRCRCRWRSLVVGVIFILAVVVVLIAGSVVIVVVKLLSSRRVGSSVLHARKNGEEKKGREGKKNA